MNKRFRILYIQVAFDNYKIYIYTIFFNSIYKITLNILSYITKIITKFRFENLLYSNLRSTPELPKIIIYYRMHEHFKVLKQLMITLSLQLIQIVGFQSQMSLIKSSKFKLCQLNNMHVSKFILFINSCWINL